MKTQVYFEDIKVGEEISHHVVETLTARSIVKWSAAVKDFYEIHYDKDFARAVGMRDVIAHGPYKCALLSRLLLEWVGEAGTLHKISCTHKASNFVGDKLTCKGKIKGKYRKDGRNYVEFEVWVENQDGIVAAPGTALISLPEKNS
jgi:acyl dehydratase